MMENYAHNGSDFYIVFLLPFLEYSVTVIKAMTSLWSIETNTT